MPATLTLDPASLSKLELSLVNTKATTNDVRFPSQAVTRGGIGVYLSTGTARGSLSRLPEALKATKAWQKSEASMNASRPNSIHSSASRPSRAATDVGSMVAAAAASVVVGGGAMVPEEAKREWERVVAHPYNFVSTARQTRTNDIRSASKWAAISFFENNPKEVQRHMDIMDIVEGAHVIRKMSEKHDGKVRHLTWALQQREVFRRQRHEVATRYEQAGVPVRRAYSATPSTRSSRYETSLRPTIHSRGDLFSQGSSQGQNGLLTQGSEDGEGNMMESWAGYFASSPANPTVSLPKPTYPYVYQRMASEVGDAMEAAAVRNKRRMEELSRQKQDAETKSQLVAMDLFEQQIQARLRENNRSLFNNGSAAQEEYND